MSPPATKTKTRTGKRRHGGSGLTAGQPSGPRWFWPGLLGICLAGAVVRFLLRAEYLASNPLAAYPTVDALTYWEWAGRIAAGQLSDGVPFFSAPLYPYLLGLLRASGGGLPSVYTIQILLDLITAGLLASVGRLRFGPTVGLLAAVVFLLMLEPASCCLRVLTATLQLPLICLAWLALLATQRRASLPRGIVAGAAIGLLALSYPPAMLYLPIFGLWWWWNARRTLVGLGRAAICVASGMAVIAPATIHNYCVSGEFFPIQSVVGINFRQGNGPGATGTITMIAGTSIDREELFRTARADFRRKHGRDGSWKEIDHYYRDQGLAYWREDPLRTARLFARKAYWFLTGYNYGDIYVPTLEIAEGLTTRFRFTPLHTAWLIPPALLAVVVWLRRLNRYVPELMLFGVPLLVTVVFRFSPRYRLPAIPVIVVASAYVLWQAWQGRRRRGWPIALGLALAASIGLGFINRAVEFDQLNPALRAQYRHMVGIALGQSGRLEEAATWCRRTLEANPEYPAAHANLGNALAQLGEPDEALDHLRLAVRAEPQNPTFNDQISRVLLEQRRFAEAIQHLRIAVESNPSDLPLRVNFANALFTTGKQAAAIEQYTAVLRSDPGCVPAHHNLARALIAQNDTAGALQHLAEATRLDPDLTEAQLLLAGTLVTQGRVQAGIDTLRRAYQRTPEDYMLTNDLAWHLATIPDLSPADRASAVTLAEQAVAQTPELSPNELDTLAAALAATGRFDRAVRTMEEALALAARQGITQEIESFRARLRLYKAGKPYITQPNAMTAPATQASP